MPLDVQASLARARTDPWGALAELALALEVDRPAFERARFAAQRRDPELQLRVEAGLAGADVDLRDVHALVLLRTLDRDLRSQRAGDEPRPHRVAVPEAWVLPRPPGWSPRLARQPNHLQHWLRFHQVLPARPEGFELHLRSASADLAERLEQGPLRVLVAGFTDGVEPSWTETDAGLFAQGLGDAQRRLEGVHRALELCQQHEAQLLVLPELALCPALRLAVQDWLVLEDHSLDLVLPGSFHEERDSLPRNVAWLLDAQAQRVLDHQKLLPFAPGEDLVEGIAGAGRLELLLTPRGLLAIAICIDFCDADKRRLWDQLGPGLVLIPSMGVQSTLSAHARQSKELQRSQAPLLALAQQWNDGSDAHGEVFHADANLLEPTDGGHRDSDTLRWRLYEVAFPED